MVTSHPSPGYGESVGRKLDIIAMVLNALMKIGKSGFHISPAHRGAGGEERLGGSLTALQPCCGLPF